MTELRCADVEARFVEAFDGRLDPAESVRFHSHIEGCAACRERASLWRALTPRLRDAVPPGPDAMATRRMQVEIERRLAGAVAAAPARRWRLWWAPTFGLVAAAAVVAIEHGRIARAAVALGSVAQKPWRLHAAEARLVGQPPTRDVVFPILTAGLADARPLAHNGYKLAMAAGAATRAIVEAAA